MSWASRGLGRPFNWASRGLGIKVLDRPGCIDVDILNPAVSVDVLSAEQLYSILEAEITFEVLKQIEVTVRCATIECSDIRSASISVEIVDQTDVDVAAATIGATSTSSRATWTTQGRSVSAEILQPSTTVTVTEECDP